MSSGVRPATSIELDDRLVDPGLGLHLHVDLTPLQLEREPVGLLLRRHLVNDALDVLRSLLQVVYYVSEHLAALRLEVRGVQPPVLWTDCFLSLASSVAFRI